MDTRPHARLGPAAHDAPDREEHEDLTNLPQVRTRGVLIAVVVAVGAFVGLFLLGWIPRSARLKALASAVGSSDARPIVDAMHPKLSAQGFDLRLPADVQAKEQTSVYSRGSGYLKRFLVDIGDRVAAGDLLAELDTPDVDADLARAVANLALVRANLAKLEEDLALADATLKRYTSVADSGAVTQQSLDERRSTLTQTRSALEVGRASVGVAEADVKRLTVLQSFERVVAPISGTITTRNYDVGALLTPATATEGHELYRIDRTDSLRVFVNVPQTYSTAVKVGDDAFLSVPNLVGREFAGKIVRSTGSIDPSTRTLRIEIDVGNADGALYPGMYGEVRLAVKTAHASLVVPTSALVFVADGTWVWVIESDRAHRKQVGVGRDFGTELEIESGLSAEDTVIKNPGERLVEGLEVRVGTAAH